MTYVNEKIIYELQNGVVSKIYKATLNSLIERVEQDGYFEESITGSYSGEYTRTVGAFALFLTEIQEYEKAKRILTFVFEAMIRNDLKKCPHTLGRVEYFNDGSFSQWVGTDDQIDGRAHIVLAYIKLCLVTENEEFENKYFNLIESELRSFLGQPYFYYVPDINHETWSSFSQRLIFNCSFEHSREFRRWSVFDLLSQSFVGACCESGILLANKRNDNALSVFLEQRLSQLKIGLEKGMTREVDGKKIYLEMRMPDGNWGKEYKGMGWVCYSPIPSGWEGLDREVLRNTIELLRHALYLPYKETSEKRITFLEYDEEGQISYSIIGKYLGWEIEYCRQEKEYENILNWFSFIDENHLDSDILMEQIALKDGKWDKADCGNGEQCVWWCWAIMRLRREMGLSPIIN